MNEDLHLLKSVEAPKKEKSGRTKGKKKEKGIRTGPATLEGSHERAKVPISWEVPAPAERPARTEWELWRLKGECSNWLEKAKRRPTQTVGVAALPCPV